MKRFNIHDCKPIKVPIPIGTKLSPNQCPKTQEEREYMVCLPYANAVGSLMYVMVGTRSDIAHAMGLLSIYMATPGREHWTVLKRCSGTYMV